MGHWGISPSDVATYWFASGCKDSKKFQFLVACNDEGSFWGHKLKGLSLQQIKALRRGLRWVQFHFKHEGGKFSTKAVIALGRISPAARKAAVSGVQKTGKIRIRDLNWGAVKALQTMPREEVVARYLRGQYAWQFLGEKLSFGGKVLPQSVNHSVLPESMWDRVSTFYGFSLVLPEGYAFGVDENGEKIYRVSSPEDDYHFTEHEAFSGERNLVERLEANAERRRQQRDVEVRRLSDSMMMDNLHLIMVSRYDSYRAGNCAAGTASFADRNGIDQRQLIRADRLIRFAKSGYDSERVMNTIRAAWERETIVMI